MSEPLEGEVVGGGPGDGAGGGRPGGHPRIPGPLDTGRFRKMWLLPVVFGSAGIVLGLLVLMWPGHTVKALTTLFGVYLLITGGYRFIAAIQLKDVDPVARVVALVLAVLSVGFGLVCLAQPFKAAATLALVVGVFWLVSGALTVFGARQRVRAALGRAPGMAGGVFAIVVGLLIMVFPGTSLVVLAWILGLWLIFFGATALATGLVARKLLNVAKDAVDKAALYWP
ncbi:MAG TPA: DUF308 domain-containing protein [Actinospica sp.]|nr:DUF308 domain-containing protein [Actinospica sp.]